jgi:hypothetical protein
MHSKFEWLDKEGLNYMNPPTVLRPVRPDERPWPVRYANFISLAVFVAAGVMVLVSDPKMFQKALAGDPHEIRFLLTTGIYPIVILFAAFAIPKAVAKQQRSVLTITDDVVTLKMRSAGVEPERVVWSVKRNDIRDVRLYGAGSKAQFIFLLKAESAIKRFWRLADTSGGTRLRAGSWVLSTRNDVSAHPPMPVNQWIASRAASRKAMLDSDLGRALIEHGYLKTMENTKS